MSVEGDVLRFDDGKSPDAMRTIGEVSKVLGIRQHVLRYWEEQFPMLRPVKRSGGRRYYRPADIDLLATIDRLVHREGFTLRGARKALAAGEAQPAPQAQAQPVAGSGDLLEGLMTVRRNLAAALENA